MLIYVAGPLSGKDGYAGKYSNIVKAVEVAEQIYDKGHYCYIPHLSTFQHRIIRKIKLGYIPTYERWLNYDFEIISRCDALFYISSSPGADKERAFAERIGKKIYTNLEDVPCGKRDSYTG